MSNKPNAKNKDDLKLTITALAFTLALAFWNFFSAGARKPVQAASIPVTTPDPATATQMTPVKILLGGPAPTSAVAVAQPAGTQPAVTQPRTQVRAPKPVARTGSSH